MGKVLTLIPKQMRVDWIDLMAIDSELSHTAFRVACVIAKHFNSATGLTFIGYQGIAKVLNTSPRTAFGAVKELEQKGYLLVRHKRGKGHANEYRPAVDKQLCTVGLAASKLEERCELLEAQMSQSAVPKLAKNCDLTLTDPTDQNTSRARARDAVVVKPGTAEFEAVRKRLIDEGRRFTLSQLARSEEQGKAFLCDPRWLAGVGGLHHAS
jgi:hypothetical protein